nr:Gag-Pol polyprotein [Tanacetum cinerariifolium]
MESIHVNFDELQHKALVHNSSDPALTRLEMASVQNSTDPGPTCQKKASVQISSDPALECQTMTLEHNSLSPGCNCQENVSHRDKTATTSNELDLLFNPMFDELLNGSSKVVFKSSAVSAADAPNQRITSNELDLLFSPMFDELLNGSSKVVSKSSAVSAADAPNERQQLTTPLNNHTTPAPTCQISSIAPTVISSENINQAEPQAENDQVTDDEFISIFLTPVQDQGETSLRHVVSKSSAVSAADAPNQCLQYTTPLNIHTTLAPTCQTPTLEPTVTSSENINQAETYAKNGQVADDEFINIFSTPVQDQGETSSHHVDSSNMHTFYQRYPSKHRWTKDHPLEQVIGNPSQPVTIRRQLESDAEMCMFALTVSRTEPKNIKEAMADSAWIESMQEELHQ